ncbi:YdeI/OmpD-associated family protein [Niabella beijingensis]|uniref:YdeI/OmpD-associated family protein n=1 Tax=Niabella beijingensis TaxID=2872700 RepID=UPI001CBF2E46|nr:YdeI/OmpD-associated family protein [Niabella beijingensis]MBZ4190830.1 YdeI/OmpD-associated family protein [Niabella beijingensis]
MATTIPEVDTYISAAPLFAQPVLLHIRRIVHKAGKDIQETIKWSCPHFDYKGRILCSMAAFKQHASFNFRLGKEILVLKPYLVLEGTHKAMGQLGRLTKVKDLPPDKVLLQALKEAMVLIDAGTSLKQTPAGKAAAIAVPGYFQKALAKNKTAKAVFEKFAPSHRNEYLQWIIDAKTEATREKRIATALEWIAEGKSRNWKYERR